jgi:Mrp family chromosome partitioning ATPase
VEPIDYRRAVTRRWPLLLVCAVVGAIIGLVIPVHVSANSSETLWQAQALAGVPPTKNSSAQTADVSQLEFFAEQTPLYVRIAKVLKEKANPGKLEGEVTLKSVHSKKKKVPPGTFYVQTVLPSKDLAANLANTFVKQLVIYANQQLLLQHDQAIQQAESDTKTLYGQLLSVDNQIAALTTSTGKGAKTPPTTTTTLKVRTPATTTTTTAPTTTTTSTTVARTHAVPLVTGDSIADACSAIATQQLACSPSSQYKYEASSDVPANDVISTDPPPGSVLPTDSLVDLIVSSGPSNSSPTSSPPSTVTTTTASQAAGANNGFALLVFQVAKHKSSTSPSGTTATTSSSSNKSQLQILQQNEAALQGEYKAAVTRLQGLQTSAAPTSGLVLLSPARASGAKEIPPTSNPFAHRSVRGGVGFLGGLLIGIALALLLDALDKRIRRSDRAAAVFGLPVIAEVPKSRYLDELAGEAPRPRAKKGVVVAPRPVSARGQIAVTDEPTSIAAEAYRRVRVAVMFGSAEIHETGTDLTDPGTWRAGGTDLSGSEFGGARVNGSAGEPPLRQVVLVVSPSLEPTAPEVVANLAAAYAEAGQTALVVTTNDLRSRGSGPTSWTQAPEPPTIQTRVVTADGPLPVVSPGEPTQPLPAFAPPGPSGSPFGRDARTRAPIGVDEVAAHCRPQQVPGVLRLELGELLRGPGEMATRGNEVLAAARQIAEVVLVEVPGLLATPDAEAISRSVDAIVVVAQCYYTTVSQGFRSARLLRRLTAPTIGIVLTAVEMSRKEQRKMSSAPPRPDLQDVQAQPAHVGS